MEVLRILLPGGLAKPPTISLHQQDADSVEDVSQMCSIRQKNTAKKVAEISKAFFGNFTAVKLPR